jgi:hypothetical protein
VKKIPTFELYQSETIRELGFADRVTAERNYEFNMRAAHQSIASSSVMNGVMLALKDMTSRYAPGRPDLLFYPAEIPADFGLKKKPFESVINKLYRKNVLYNKSFPGTSRDTIRPENFYEEIDDLIRTRIVCKYMDGPKFVCEELKRYCGCNGIDAIYRDVSTHSGYYAWHFYLKVPVELMFNTSVEGRSMWVEIQISTQLAEVITALTHELYETRRMGSSAHQSGEWKWDAASHRFRSAYLGHGLHLLEGIIQNLKDDLLIQSRADSEPDNNETIEKGWSGGIDEVSAQTPTPTQALAGKEEG